MALMIRCVERAAVAVALGLVAVVLGLEAPSALATTKPQARITRLGATAASQRLSLVLPLQTDKPGLAAFAAAVSDPGSPQYGQYESVPELAQRFGATTGERAQVLGYLRRTGATGVKIDPSGLFADATMTAGLAHRLFGAELTEFRTASAARFTAPTTAVTIPAGLAGAVTGVVGLDTVPLELGRPQAPAASAVRASAASAGASTARHDAQPQSGYLARTGTAAGCPVALRQGGFTPNQYLTAYGYTGLYAKGLTGTGERVALIEINGYKASDVRTYAKCFSLHVPKITNYRVGINKLLAPGGEATLDLEVLSSAAPNLKGIDVYESTARASSVLQALTTPLANPGRKPDVISVSLGDCEKDTKQAIGGRNISTVEASLQMAAASGISVLASSGDDGSSACVDQRGVPEFEAGVNFPASSPWITGVGGTNIALTAANTLSAQIVWNDEDGSGGGGYSTLFRRPSWQTGLTTSGRRVVPDVSMLADPAPGYLVYCTASGDCLTKTARNPWISFGGTSAGTPLLAGGLALVDENLRRQGQLDIGMANPLLARVYKSPLGPSVFSDVTQYNNDLFGLLTGGQHAVGCCTARAGFDAASGMGSVNIAGLSAAASGIVRKARPVAPFSTKYVASSVPHRSDELLLSKIFVIGVSKRELVSGGCLHCGNATENFSVKQEKNRLVLTLRKPAPVSARSLVIVDVTAREKLGRFKLYAFRPKTHSLAVKDQGCTPSGSILSPANAAQTSSFDQVSCGTGAK
jgi:subtilase family serine protease